MITISYEITDGFIICFSHNLTETDISGVINEAYVYNDNGAITSLTNTLAAVTQGYAYTYDTDGNITGITKTVTQNNNTSTVTESYTYDGNNQLVTAIIGNKKWTYAYDTRGNITEKKEYTLSGNTQTLVNTDTFTYGNTAWQDELTVFNNQSVSYDAAGNPTSYRGHTLTWTMGRRLASYDGISYTYNEEGIRTSKTYNGITTRYYLDGTNVIGQTDGTNTLYFRYDSNNSLISVIYNGTEYYYVKNGLGDITGIVDANGTLVAEYAYDPWGKVISVTGSNTSLANANPFRYRGYYYDTDTGMYYLQSRYYAPEICRFINADGLISLDRIYTTADYNLFEYCYNNSLIFRDSSGNSPTGIITSIAVAIVYVYAIVVLAGVMINIATGGQASLATGQAIVNITRALWESLKNGTTSLITTITLYFAAQKLGSIARKHGIGNCDKAAKEMEKYLRRRGLSGSVLTLSFSKDNNPSGIVYSQYKQIQVGDNNFHMGVYFNSKVYCTVYPEGVSLEFLYFDFINMNNEHGKLDAVPII